MDIFRQYFCYTSEKRYSHLSVSDYPIESDSSSGIYFKDSDTREKVAFTELTPINIQDSENTQVVPMNKVATFVYNNPKTSFAIGVTAAVILGEISAISYLATRSDGEAMTAEDQDAFTYLGNICKNLAGASGDVICQTLQKFQGSEVWKNMSALGHQTANMAIQSVYDIMNAPCNATNTYFNATTNESTYFPNNSMTRDFP